MPYTFLESLGIIHFLYAFGFLGTYQSMPYRRFKHAVGEIVPLESGHVPQFAIVTFGRCVLNPVPGASNLRQRGEDGSLFK